MKQRTHAWWLKKTNIDFNKWIRLKSADSNGMVTCVTCGAVKHYKEAHAGHYIHGYDFCEQNQHPQCIRCNKILSGNLAKYSKFIIDTYGIEVYEKLHFEGNQKHKYPIPELQEMRAEYKQKIKDLEWRIYGN
jgi:hypothetical protein